MREFYHKGLYIRKGKKVRIFLTVPWDETLPGRRAHHWQEFMGREAVF
jgi:hypothetical protein